MFHRRLAILACSAFAAAAFAGAAHAAPAPGFTAVDADGKPVSLAQFKGRTVVLEWVNEGCPYVQKHYGARNMQDTQAEAHKQGAVWLTVISSAPGKQGYFTGPQAKAWAAKQGASPDHILLDPKGELGMLYGAKTTPDMRVIDAQGALVYQGGIDDIPTANPADLAKARNLVKAALGDIAAKRPVAVAYAKPYGCSIKYPGV
jgi:peroxiredoxin